MLSDDFSFLPRCLCTTVKENDITWSYLLTMEKEDLGKVMTERHREMRAASDVTAV